MSQEGITVPSNLPDDFVVRIKDTIKRAKEAGSSMAFLPEFITMAFEMYKQEQEEKANMPTDTIDSMMGDLMKGDTGVSATEVDQGTDAMSKSLVFDKDGNLVVPTPPVSEEIPMSVEDQINEGDETTQTINPITNEKDSNVKLLESDFDGANVDLSNQGQGNQLNSGQDMGTFNFPRFNDIGSSKIEDSSTLPILSKLWEYGTFTPKLIADLFKKKQQGPSQGLQYSTPPDLGSMPLSLPSQQSQETNITKALFK